VSDTTLRTDRTLKASLYAEAGVKDYWIVNLKAHCIEVYREPAAMPRTAFTFGYQSRRLYTGDATLAPLAAPEAVISVPDILPPE
jgi:Uma2 family endonuclease